MHLAVVSPFPPAITGIGQYGYHITRALTASNVFERITVLAGSHTGGIIPNHLGQTKIDYCWAPGQLKARTAILSNLKRLNPDLIWFNVGASMFGKSPWTNLSGLLTPIFAKRLGFPTVITLHELMELSDLRALHAPGGVFASIGARLFTSIGLQADVLCLTMSQYTRFMDGRGTNCMHIPIGAYHQPEILNESCSQELLFFTTLAPFKGLELLIEVFQHIRLKYPHLKLTIAGTSHNRFPDFESKLRSQFQGLSGIQWLGQVEEDEVKNLFERAQIIVLPYTASTGSSSVLYQAATWGRPVIASDLHEIKQLVSESNLHVEFFKTGNSTSLYGAIETLLISPEKRFAQAQQNFRAIQHLGPTETCRKYMHAFNRAFEKRLSPKRIRISEQQLI